MLLTVTHVKMESLVMKHLIPKTMTAVPVLALALAVGGCGSSSDDDGGMPIEPTAEEIRAEKMTACTDAGGRYEESDGSCTPAAELIAEAAAMACTAAGGRVEDDGSCTPAVEVMAEAAEAACTSAMGRYEPDGSCTSAADLVEEARMACTDAGGRFEDDESCTPASVLATTAAAGTKAAAIRAEQAQTVMVGIGGDAAIEGPDGDVTATDDNVDNPNSYIITRDSDDPATVEVTDTRMDDDDDPKYEDQMAGLDGRTMLVREMKADDDGNVVKEVVMVGTNIEAPEAVKFAEFESADGMTPQALNTRDLDANVNANADEDNDPANDWTAKTVGANASTAPDEDERKLVMSDAFVNSGAQMTVLTFDRQLADADTVMPGNQPREAFETEGTYNGAMGTYRCNAADSDCTVTLDDEGAITAMSAGWVFTPNEGATSDQPDYQYLSYGFWLMNTTDADGVLTYNEVETFAMAHGYVTSDGATLVGDVTGSANYSGTAVGVYVKNVTDTAADIVSSTSGAFSADVELTATFGGDAVAPNDRFAVDGMVTGFDLSGGEANDWDVTLGLADFSGRAAGNEPGESAPGTTFARSFSGVATGDEAAAAGTWNGMFHGRAGQVNHDDDLNTPAINTAPGAVTGEFNANFTDGTVAGGFGAEED